VEKKAINIILIFSCSIIFFVICTIIYISNSKNENPGCAVKDTPKLKTKFDAPERQKGKVIFNSNCAACHKVNAISDPDLIKNLLQRMPNEEYFGLFITNEDSLRKANDKYAKSLTEKFPTGYSHNFKFNKEEIENLKKYIK